MRNLQTERTITLAGATNYSGEVKRWRVITCTTQALKFGKLLDILSNNIPEDARIIRSCYDEICDELSFILESDDFDPIQPDRIIPFEQANFFEIAKDCSTCRFSHALTGELRCFNDKAKIGTCPQPFYCSEFKPLTEALDV